MSTDVVDDLHAAEDFAGCAVACLEELAALVRTHLVGTDAADARTDQALGRARSLISSWPLCRPSCGGPGECEDDCCGCPCDCQDGADAEVADAEVADRP